MPTFFIRPPTDILGVEVFQLVKCLKIVAADENFVPDHLSVPDKQEGEAQIWYIEIKISYFLSRVPSASNM